MKREAMLVEVVASRARDTPDLPYLEEAGSAGRASYADVQQLVERWVEVYRGAGVQAGDTVLAMLPSSLTEVCSWLGLAWLGAVEVPVNTAYQGRMLEHVVNDSRASLMLLSERHVDQVAAVADELPGLRTAIVPDARGKIEGLPFTVLDGAEALDSARPGGVEGLDRPAGRDTACILYTSGTTGPPKGVEVTWAQLHATALGLPPFAGLIAEDAYYSTFPAFHIGGKHPPYVMALAGGRLVLKDGFRTQDFWPEIRDHGCTVTFLLSAMTQFVYTQPRRPDDAENPLRHVIMVPLIGELDDFRTRYGVEVSTIFNMTEVSCPIVSDGARLVDARSCGRRREGYDVRIADENDEAVATGEVGELLVRADAPWVHMSGYWGAPEKTLEAFRNQWFHTGDAFTCDADGNYYFVERVKDVIRRRGENIASSEIEVEAVAHPEIAACAAVGIPSRWGEEEVKLVVVAEDGCAPEPAAILEHLAARLPGFMVPRYIELVGELPMTPTQKVRKAELRSVGITAETWDGRPDREPAAGGGS